jgi:hypothetical protein
MAFFDALRHGFRDVKDSMVEAVAQNYLNHRIQSFGSIRGLKIDSTAKTITLTLELKGETAPVEVQCARYRLIEEGDQLFIEVYSLETSREWIDIAFGEFVKNRRFEVPRSLRQAL